jgi:hypothetical protein
MQGEAHYELGQWEQREAVLRLAETRTPRFPWTVLSTMLIYRLGGTTGSMVSAGTAIAWSRALSSRQGRPRHHRRTHSDLPAPGVRQSRTGLLIWEPTRAFQRLRSTLRDYFPGRRTGTADQGTDA